MNRALPLAPTGTDKQRRKKRQGQRQKSEDAAGCCSVSITGAETEATQRQLIPSTLAAGVTALAQSCVQELCVKQRLQQRRRQQTLTQVSEKERQADRLGAGFIPPFVSSICFYQFKQTKFTLPVGPKTYSIECAPVSKFLEFARTTWRILGTRYAAQSTGSSARQLINLKENTAGNTV